MNKSKEKKFWIPVNAWNLNELFTTESISPISFYKDRGFGNPVNRNQERIEDENNLILFNDEVQSEILLSLSSVLLSSEYLKEIKFKNKFKLRCFEYSKTIYLKKGLFNLYFSNQEKVNEFVKNAFMLLEVKTLNKYKSDFIVDERIGKKGNNPVYQSQLLSNKNKIQPFFDKAFNQFKGLIYGYCIGSIGTMGENEEALIFDLSTLKNTIGGINTDIAMTDMYSNFWLINARKHIIDCQKSYFETFGKQSDILDTIYLRLEEINKLNKMRCSDLERQKSTNYKRDYETELKKLEKVRQDIYTYELKHEIAPLKEELTKIKQKEENKGKLKGKTREYYKIGSYEYNRKQELKYLIVDLENDNEYQQLKEIIKIQEEKVRNFQFGFTQFDSSISEQFSRISEYLHDIIKQSTSYFLLKNKQSNKFPDISLEIDIQKLANHYSLLNTDYDDFSVKFSENIVENLTDAEIYLLTVSINSILSQPQGQLGNISEENILEIIKNIGEHLPESIDKQTLREYYLYRVGKTENFIFPKNFVLANLVIFLMKLNGHEQINKMLVSKNIGYKHIAFMLYGAYVGFANMPKTFTNIIFESNDSLL